MQQVVARQVDPVDQREARLRPFGHRDRDRAVQLDDRGGPPREQLPVERGDLRPVGLVLEVERRDRRLELVRAGPAEPQGAVEQAAALLDPGPVPERAVLLLQQHERLAASRLAAGVVEEHQRRQAERLGLVRHQHGEQLPEPNGLVAELVAHRRAVARVEDEVERRERSGRPLREEVVGRHAERDPGGADLALGAHEPLGHRRLRHEEGTGHLRRGQPAHRLERQRHLRVDGEGRVAAGEDQREPLVGQGVHVVLLGRLGPREQLGLSLERPGAADPVDRRIPRDGLDPGPRPSRDPAPGPRLEGLCERVLHRVLGELEVAEDADQGREDAAPLVPEDALELVYPATSAVRSTTGRTSIEPLRADGIRAAHWIASSIVSASIR